MNRATIVIILGLTLLFNQANAQTFKQQFNELVSKNDTLAQEKLLAEWEKTDANDPELYVAYFNHFAIRSKKEMVMLGQNPKGEDVLQIMDQDSTNGEPVAFIYGDTYYDWDILKKGVDYIDKGIAKYPNRLDMRFGKIYMFGEIGNYENFTNEIIKAIDYSAVNNNKWTWADNEPLEDAKNTLLASLQDYQLQLYNTENEALLDNMKRIAEAVLKHYPDHIESLSNLAIVHMLRKDYELALDPLLKAEKLNPADYIVLSNLAYAYKSMFDKKNAIKYYELTIKYGDEQAKKYAQQQLDELKKN